MSYILEDPNPGRCKNFRSITHPDSVIERLRCLDYEGVPHQCSFPKPTHVVSVRNNIFSTLKGEEDKPKPWVKPEVNEERYS